MTPAHNRYKFKGLTRESYSIWFGLCRPGTGACFAEAGNNVVCVDIDAGKVARLQQGEIPIHEPGLDVLVKRNFHKGRLKFTTDAEEGIRHGLFQFIAVGTPPEEDGSADLSHVLVGGRDDRPAHDRLPHRRGQIDRARRHGRQGPRAHRADARRARRQDRVRRRVEPRIPQGRRGDLATS